MQNLFNKLSTRVALGGVVLAAALGISMYAFATAGPVTPATGGSNVSIDTSSAAVSPAWTTLNGLVIQESTAGDIATGLHTVTLPAGWEFDTSSSITTSISGGEIVLNAPNITPGPGNTSFSFTVVSAASVNVGSITFNNIIVRPTGTTPSTGNMTMTAGVVTGVTNGVTNFGTLTTVPGTATKLAFTTQPSFTTVYGSTFATQPVVKTQDQFGNNSTPTTGVNNVTLSLNGTGSINGTTVLDIGSTGVATFSGLAITDVGTGKSLTATAAGLTTATSAVFDITAKPITASITADNKTYDGNTTATISGASVTSQIAFSDTLGVDTTGYAATFSDASAGTGKTVTVTGLSLTGDTTKYSLASTNTGTANIDKATVNVAASTTLSRVYGNTDPTLAYSDSGLISGNSFSGSLSRATGENTGTYAITAGTLSAGSNYNISYTGANLTITARPITVTAASSTKTYDNTNTSTGVPTITSGTLAFSDTANFSQVYGDELVGTGKTLTPGGTVNDSNGGNNYSYTFTPTTNGTILAKELTVTGLSASTKVYDGNTSATLTGTAALSGIISPDTVTLSGVEVGTFSTSTVGTNNVAVSGLSITGTDAGNYYLTQPTLSAAITAKPVTVTPDSGKTKVYGDTDPTFTYTTSALIGGDLVTGNPARATGESVGVHSINAIGTLSASSNYSLSVSPVDFTITTAPLTITAANKTKVYGATDPTLTVTYTGLKNSDSAPSTLPTISRTVGENVGTYDITPSAAVDTNYTISYATGTLSITPATLTVTADNKSKEYTATPTPDPALTYTTGSFTNGDTASVMSGSLTRVAGESIGTYSINQGTVTAGSNYSISYTAGTFSIVDTTPPVIAPHVDINAVADQLGGATASASYTAPIAADDGDGPLAASCTPTSGTFFAIGTTTVTCTKTDTYGNVATPTTFKVVVVPGLVTKFAIGGTPSTVDITAASTIAVTGQDQYGNTANDNSTVALLNTDNGASLSNGFLTLTAGVASTQLTKATTGIAHVVVSSGSVTPKQTTITFTDASDRTAPVIYTIATNKAVYEATNDTIATVTITEDNTASSVTINGAAATETTPGTWVASFTKSSTVGTHSISVSASDISGNISTMTGSYTVVANVVTPVVPTVALSGAAINPAYSLSQAQTRFASGVQFTTTNAASVTVNGTSVTPGATITADTLGGATALGIHTYNVVVTSSTGNTANLTISYQVNANNVTPVTPTVALSGAAILPSYSATDAAARFASGVEFTTTNAASVTVNGTSVTPGATITADTLGNATTLGAHTYNVVVTSSTGHTASTLISYQVTADNVTPVIPTVALSGAAIVSSYTASDAAARFASGVEFTTTNAASVTVNGTSVTPGATITADTLGNATTLGAHTYNVVVTSSTGHTANITVAYQVTADPVVQGNGTLGVTGISTTNSTMTADNSYTNGGSWTFFITVPTSETNLALKFGDWVSGANSIATANNMRIYSAQSSNATTSSSAITVTAANTYSTSLLLTGDLNPSVEGRQVSVTVDLKVPTTTLGGSYSTNYGVLSN